MDYRRSLIFGYGLCCALSLVACGGRGAYRIHETFTACGRVPDKVCRRTRPTYVVPTLPAADVVIGDLVVTCEIGCEQDHALRALMKEAERHGAAHVSNLSCVQREEGWICVGRASAPPLCEEES